MKRVAVLSDVHGNAPALEAVLAEVEQVEADLIVFGGDLTWGPLPDETFQLVRGLGARFVRGNADRAVLENVSETEREQWMQEHHTDELRGLLASFEEQVVVEIDGLGRSGSATGRRAPTRNASPQRHRKSESSSSARASPSG